MAEGKTKSDVLKQLFMESVEILKKQFDEDWVVVSGNMYDVLSDNKLGCLKKDELMSLVRHFAYDYAAEYRMHHRANGL
jgi:hypothetical protein|tara:strand:+ start:46 stop:282 length:237 start_codon:yes stop_codon:yes gene_type:complete